jgi:hypothetical protein
MDRRLTTCATGNFLIGNYYFETGIAYNYHAIHEGEHECYDVMLEILPKTNSTIIKSTWLAKLRKREATCVGTATGRM